MREMRVYHKYNLNRYIVMCFRLYIHYINILLVIYLRTRSNLKQQQQQNDDDRGGVKKKKMVIINDS